MDKTMDKTQKITRTALILALALTVQLLRFPQPITGPVINALLLLAVMLIGPGEAVVIGCLTPGIAWIVGILPPVMGPLVPFIMLANALFSVVFSQFFRRNSNNGEFPLTTANQRFRCKLRPLGTLALGAGLAAFAKFGLLWWVSQSLVDYLYQLGWLKAPIPPLALLTFQLPQLYSALAGGALALLLYAYLSHKLFAEN